MPFDKYGKLAFFVEAERVWGLNICERMNAMRNFGRFTRLLRIGATVFCLAFTVSVASAQVCESGQKIQVNVPPPDVYINYTQPHLRKHFSHFGHATSRYTLPPRHRA